MKPYSFESIFPNSATIPRHEKNVSEKDAEELLESILSDPENSFLYEHEVNRTKINDAPTACEALSIAESLIRKRLEITLNAREIHGNHSEKINVNPDSVLNTLEHIRRHAKEIGIGADGRVVVDTTDILNVNPEICYKFSLHETVARGRNSFAEEAELQGAFYEMAAGLSSRDIGVPMPYYEIEVFSTQMIAMEKLHAKSVDEIMRGIGTLPEWFDPDRFCDSLEAFIDAAHKVGLYHRDLHYGNLMISQRRTWTEGDPIGYVIDFGLSSYEVEGMDPYKKEVAGTTYTYVDDYGRVSNLRKTLKELRSRSTFLKR